MKISKLASQISTSPILTFAAEINARIANYEVLHNLTVGDFNPHIYQIPTELKSLIIRSYQAEETNYPGALGLPNLRNAIKDLIESRCHIKLDVNNILVASGSRPLIYSTYKTIVDKGDKVIFPVPSWNNDYYSILTEGNAVTIETSAENNFMPTKAELEPHIKGATLLALCSPQNPTGTLLSKQQLSDICDLVIAENQSRSANEKPLYIMFDQVYWLLVFDPSSFHHAQSINPKIADYAVFIDGISKCLAATGVRVGWATGPADVIGKMRSLVAHIGAWAPRAEQVATGEYLSDLPQVTSYLNAFNVRLQDTLNQLHLGFERMRQKGLPVASIKPEASIYLSVQLPLIGKITDDGTVLNNVNDVQNFLLNKAKVALLPFTWFGAENCLNWYRISIGTLKPEALSDILIEIESAITTLK